MVKFLNWNWGLVAPNVFGSSSVQHECIPQAILGMDVICQAKSGMGKTAVFVLSTLQQIEPVAGQVAALVLCHTRELAYQVRVLIWKFSAFYSCRVLVDYLVCSTCEKMFNLLTDYISADLSWVWEVQHLSAWYQGCCFLWWCQHQAPQRAAEEWMPSYCCWNSWKNTCIGKRQGPIFEECEAFYTRWMWQDAWITWYVLTKPFLLFPFLKFLLSSLFWFSSTSFTYADMRRDVQEIFKMTPHDKQVMMFSATLSKEIRPVCKKFMQDVMSCGQFLNLEVYHISIISAFCRR